MLTFLVFCSALLFLFYGWAYLDSGLHLLCRDEFHVKAILTAVLGLLMLVASFGIVYLRITLIYKYPILFQDHPVARVELLEQKVSDMERAIEQLKPKEESK